MNLTSIKEKLAYLASRDNPDFLHMPLAFNACLTDVELASFERAHSLVLPEDYRAFLMEIGNGGFGPSSGLRALNPDYVDDPRFPIGRDMVDLGTEFGYQTFWNGDVHSAEEWADKAKEDSFLDYYFSVERQAGTLCICDLGCGCAVLLVVKGKEYGTLWRDDRGSHGGLYPESLTHNSEIGLFGQFLFATGSER